MTDDQKLAELKSRDFLYKQCIEIRNFEISNLVNRNNFFMVFQGVLIAGVLQATAANLPKIVVLFACGFGLLISLLQTGMSSGAKFWQEVWEFHLEETEKKLGEIVHDIDPKKNFHLLFSENMEVVEKKVRKRLDDGGCFSSLLVRRFSVSKIPIYCGIVFSLFWGAFFISSLNRLGG